MVLSVMDGLVELMVLSVMDGLVESMVLSVMGGLVESMVLSVKGGLMYSSLWVNMRHMMLIRRRCTHLRACRLVLPSDSFR